MASPELSAWVDQVIEETTLGKITWKLMNPTTYVWETQVPRPARVVLQRTERIEAQRLPSGQVGPRKVVNYLMQAFDLQKIPPVPSVTLNGVDDTDVNTQLDRLYTQVASIFAKENLDFLKSLLPK